MTVFPTAYFGSIGYFRELLKAEDVYLEAKEHFVKQTLRTRCTILGANGKQQLSVPVEKPLGSKTPMDQLIISQTEKWQKDHWKSIESAYAASPYFDAYDREIKGLIYSEERNLLRFNNEITQSILSWLHLQKDVRLTTEYSVFENDFRQFDFEKEPEPKKYIQVFNHGGFSNGLSILDLLFCEGPMARNFILS
jgi:hypothetical protein